MLCARKSWDEVIARIKKLPTQGAVAELFYQDELGVTAFADASAHKAPVEVLESMLLLAKLDAEKRNILDIATAVSQTPLLLTAQFHPDPAATKLLVRHYPSALLVKSARGNIPLYGAIEPNESPTVASFLRKLTAAYEHGHFSGLIRLCGTSNALEALAVRSTDDVPLLVLCQYDLWGAASTRIEKIPAQTAIEEMHEKDEEKRTRLRMRLPPMLR